MYKKLPPVSRMIALVDVEDATREAVAAAIEGSGQGDAALARALGISRQTANNYRNARNTIPLDTAVVLARHLRLTLNQLAGVEALPEASLALRELAGDLSVLSRTQSSSAAALQEIVQRADRLAVARETDVETG